MAEFRVEIPPPVAELVRHLPPDVKRGVKQALRASASNPELGELLQGELAGLWRYRVRRFRIVYEVVRRRRIIRVYAVGHRRRIYEETVEVVRRQRL